MKKLYTLFLLVFAFITHSQAVSLVSEAFTSGSIPSGWTQSNVTFTTSAGGYANISGSTGVLNSPTYDWSGYENILIEFSVAKYGSGTDGSITVDVSNDGGATWTAYTASSPTPTSSTYLSASINVPNSAINNNVKIRFTAASSPSNKRFRNLAISGDVKSLCAAPSISTSSFTNGTPGSTNSISLNWADGNGAGRVIVMNNTNSFTNLITGANPTANLTYTGSGEQVIFNGTGSGPITVAGLSTGTTYYFKGYEYCSPDRVYNNSGVAESKTTSSGTNTITTTSASYGPFCNGSTQNISVDYSSSGTFSGTFKVQISDEVSSFPNNTTSNIIGSGTSPITATIPSGLIPGSAYRIRVVNDNPTTYGTNNGSDIQIIATPTTPTASTPAAVCEGTSVQITATGSTNATSYTFWDQSTGGNQITSGVSGSTLTTPSSLSVGTHYYYIQGENGICASARQQIAVQINAVTSVDNITSPTSTANSNTVQISWTNPSLCWDEVMIVLTNASGLTFSPSGDGSSYTANNVYSGSGDQVVYKGTGTTLSVSNLTTATDYYFEMYVRKGTVWSSGIELKARTVIPIPDNGCSTSQYAEYPIIISETQPILDVNLGVKISHTYRGDLRVWLISPDNTSVLLLSNPGSSADNIDVIVDDQAAGNIFNTSHVIDDTYDEVTRPTGTGVGALSEFYGKNPSGTWIVRVCDNASSDTGAIVFSELFITTCNDPKTLEVSSIANTHQNSTIAPFTVSLKCSNGQVSPCNTGNITLSFSGCAITGTLTRPLVNGVATFNDLSVSRSLQNTVHFTASYSGGCGSPSPQQSNSFNITAPSPIITTVVKDEDFEGTSAYPWSYSAGANFSVGTYNSNKFIGKVGNSSSVTETITFNSVSGLSVYDSLLLSFKVGSSVGISGNVGNDSGEDMTVEVQLDGGSWTTVLVHKGFGNKKFDFSTNPLTHLTPTSNQTIGNTDTSSAFIVTIPSGTSSLAFRYTASNNSATELWCMDDIKLIGYSTGSCISDSLPLLTVYDTSMCAGATAVQLNVTSANYNTSAAYQWTPASGLSEGNVEKPFVNPDTTTEYTVVITDADGCKDTAHVLVTVKDSPEITTQPQDISACYSQLIVVTSAVSPTYQWEIFNPSTSDWDIIAPSTSNLSGEQTDELTITGGFAGFDGRKFRNKVSADGCTSISDSAQYTLEPALVNTSVLGNSDLNATPCDYNGWTYYTSNDIIGKYGFAINWAPDLSISTANQTAKNGADVIITLDNNYFSNEDVSGSPAYATYTMRRYWNVNIPNSIDESVQVLFPYLQSEVDEIVQAAQTFVTNNPGSSYENFSWFKLEGEDFVPNTSIVKPINIMNSIPLQDAYASTQPQGFRLAQFNGITSFSGGTGATGAGGLNNPLPVTLLYFVGNCQNSDIILSWATASELNAEKFVVEASLDGYNFIQIGEVNAAGNSNSLREYSFNASNGNYPYYRLKQLDLDGKFELSKIVQRPCESLEDQVKVYSTSIHGIVVEMVSSKSKKIDIHIYDVSGQLMYKSVENVSVGNQRWNIPTDKLPVGVYVVTVSDQYQNTSTKVSVFK